MQEIPRKGKFEDLREGGNGNFPLNIPASRCLVSAVMFETCSVLSLSSVEVPHIRFKFKDVRLNKPFNDTPSQSCATASRETMHENP